MFPNYRHWNYRYTAKGLLKKRAKTVLRITAMAGIVTGLYFAQRAGCSLCLEEGVAAARGASAQLLNALGHYLVRMAGSI